MLTTSCSHLPSSSLPISLLSKDLLSTRECFSLDFENGHTNVQILGFSASLITPVVFLGRRWTFPHDPDPFSLMDKQGVTSANGRPQQGKAGLLVEWMEKVSFVRLNKLFEIDAIERAHIVLLSNKNLHVLIKNPKSFIISVFPWLAPSSLVLDEHFVLKDLSFHEVACLADSSTSGSSRETGEEALEVITTQNMLFCSL
ncbi:hypothetical protein AAG906_040661 [Vitis piasezkii]